MLRYLKGNESESKSQPTRHSSGWPSCCCVTSKVMNLKANHNYCNPRTRLVTLLRYLKGNESESKSQHIWANNDAEGGCCVTSKVMNLKANHNKEHFDKIEQQVVALPQR